MRKGYKTPEQCQWRQVAAEILADEILIESGIISQKVEDLALEEMQFPWHPKKEISQRELHNFCRNVLGSRRAYDLGIWCSEDDVAMVQTILGSQPHLLDFFNNGLASRQIDEKEQRAKMDQGLKQFEDWYTNAD